MYRLPKLPTLTIKNRKQYPQWHTYFERVYGHEVHEKINLNYFTFFYNFSPLGVWPQTDLPKEVQPQFILDVEKSELHINAGLQDRVIQVNVFFTK